VNCVETLDPKAISPEVPELLTESKVPEATEMVRDNPLELALSPVVGSVTVIMMPDMVPGPDGTPLMMPV
jgi:hypothetical protein